MSAMAWYRQLSNSNGSSCWLLLELYTKQQGLGSNLFLAAGEGDSASQKQNRNRSHVADALRLVRGEKV